MLVFNQIAQCFPASSPKTLFVHRTTHPSVQNVNESMLKVSVKLLQNLRQFLRTFDTNAKLILTTLAADGDCADLRRGAPLRAGAARPRPQPGDQHAAPLLRRVRHLAARQLAGQLHETGKSYLVYSEPKQMSRSL